MIILQKIKDGICFIFQCLGHLFFFTWTPKIHQKNGISELRKIEINNTKLAIMIRGTNKDNPVALFVHGGPCCSEIPYARKYQSKLEQNFTVVHYDQRGSGKSCNPKEDYSALSADVHVDDLIALTKYLQTYLHKEKVILIGHSYGTYVSTKASAKAPELFEAYVGIGQLGNMIESELDGLNKCIEAAKGNEEDIKALEAVREQITSGVGIVPRNYTRKYGFAARQIDDNKDYIRAFLFGPEYNFLEAYRFFTVSMKPQVQLFMEVIQKPLPVIVPELHVPVYFIMGKYDGMTSPRVAQEYLDQLHCSKTKEMIYYDHSAHYPQFEEEDKFNAWMCSVFK